MIEAFVLWNEPNNLSHWNFHLDAGWSRFAEMTKAAAPIRAAHPKLSIVLGGVSACDGDFLRLMSSLGVMEYVDIVGVRGFPPDWNHWQIDDRPARIGELLIYARQRIPGVQANLVKTAHDDGETVADWQRQLKSKGVWVSELVPMFPLPGSPQFLETFGEQPGDDAWERAHSFNLDLFDHWGEGDIQEQHPLPPRQLEGEEHPCAS